MIRVLVLASLGLYAAVATGCSSTDGSNPPMLAPAALGALVAPEAPELCANHEEGCPCDEPDATIDCGRVKRVAGDYVWCSTGKQTCSYDGTWSKCGGDTAVVDSTTRAH